MEHIVEVFNCYVGAIANTEAEARKICAERFNEEPLQLVHMEPAQEEEEQPVWIFSFLADSLEEAEGEFLFDHYTLSTGWPNLSFEMAN